MWDLMREVSLSHSATRHFMVGIWPVIERFPAYMALSLLKTRFGRSPGDNLARRWLVRNIRVEQNHAEYRSEEHTSELQSLMRISYAVFCLKNKKTNRQI